MNKAILAGLACLPFSLHLAAAEVAKQGEVIVTASRLAQPVQETLADVTVITQEEIRKAGPVSLPQLLQRQPGLEIYTTGSTGSISGVYVRGASPSQTLFLVDGMRLSSATSGTTAIEHIPLSQIERIEIVRGPASSLYGADALGGVIQLFTKDGEQAPKPNVKLGYGSYRARSAEAGYGGKIGSTRFNIGMSHYETDGINSTQQDNFGFNPDRDSYRNNTLNASLAHEWAEGQEIGARFLETDARLHFDSGLASDDYTDQDLRSWSLFSKNRLASRWTSNLQFGRTTDSQKTFGSTPNLYATEQDQISWQNDIDTGYGTLILGTERLEQRVNSTVNFIDESRDIQSYLAGWLGSYGAHSVQINLRQDRNSQFGDRETGSLNYGYRFAPQWRATVGYGTAFRAPTFLDLYFPGFFGFSTGNPDLRPERSRNTEAGLYYEGTHHNLSLVVFENDVRDLIGLSGPLFLPTNISNAELRGISLGWKGNWDATSAHASLDIQSPRDEDSGNLLPRRAQRNLKLGMEQRFGAFSMGGETIARSMRYEDTANTTRLAGYALVNLYAQYQLDTNWSLQARLNNVFDKEYELSSTFNTLGSNLFVSVSFAPQ
jgi:vitamin B12 transporter